MATFRPVGLSLNQTILHSEVELLLQILLLKNCHYIALFHDFPVSTFDELSISHLATIMC